MKSYSAQKEHTSASGKNAQNLNGQKLLLAKNYLEQQLETAGYSGHVKYDLANKALVQYRTQEGTIAIIKEGKLYIFEMPVKKFKGALPLEVQSVDMDSIQIQKATCCKKCHQWKKTANITRCSCGGYLVPRKRFAVDAVESWDEEFLEIEFARKDIRAAKRIERVLSNRPKRYNPTGITPKLSGMSSVTPENNKPRRVTRVSTTGAMWLEEFGESALLTIATIKKMDGFVIPQNKDVQNSIREQLCRKFTCGIDV